MQTIWREDDIINLDKKLICLIFTKMFKISDNVLSEVVSVDCNTIYLISMDPVRGEIHVLWNGKYGMQMLRATSGNVELIVFIDEKKTNK